MVELQAASFTGDVCLVGLLPLDAGGLPAMPAREGKTTLQAFEHSDEESKKDQKPTTAMLTS